MSKIYVSDNQLLLEKMLTIYQPTNIDWMAYRITTKNGLAIYRIPQECDSGNISTDWAIVTPKGQQMLSELESRNLLLYQYWNELFGVINATKSPPSNALVKEIRSLRKHTQKYIK